MLSVCMATFNGERYIQEQLQSILKQLSPNDELIISDDGSTDQTYAIVQEYIANDGRITLLKGPGKGLIANFEHAIAHAKGNLIFLADQDDVWMDGKVTRIVQYFDDHPETLVVVSDLIIVNNELEVLFPSYFDYRKAKEGWVHNLVRSHYIGAGMAFRQTLVKKVLPIPHNVPMHDMWIGMVAGKHTHFIKEPLTLYRRHDYNVSEIKTNSTLRQKLIWRVSLLRELIKRAGGFGKKEKTNIKDVHDKSSN